MFGAPMNNVSCSWGQRGEGSAFLDAPTIYESGQQTPVYHSTLRSTHVGFNDSINAIFFARAQPLQLLLALDGVAHFGEPLELDQPMAVVTRGESAMGLLLVLKGAPLQIAGDTDVKGAATARHDVRAVGALVHG